MIDTRHKFSVSENERVFHVCHFFFKSEGQEKHVVLSALEHAFRSIRFFCLNWFRSLVVFFLKSVGPFFGILRSLSLLFYSIIRKNSFLIILRVCEVFLVKLSPPVWIDQALNFFKVWQFQQWQKPPFFVTIYHRICFSYKRQFIHIDTPSTKISRELHHSKGRKRTPVHNGNENRATSSAASRAKYAPRCFGK